MPHLSEGDAANVLVNNVKPTCPTEQADGAGMPHLFNDPARRSIINGASRQQSLTVHVDRFNVSAHDIALLLKHGAMMPLGENCHGGLPRMKQMLPPEIVKSAGPRLYSTR
jgi:hypothetical protein